MAQENQFGFYKRIQLEDTDRDGVVDAMRVALASNYELPITFGKQLRDTAGRLRISEPISLGDYKLINTRLPLFFDTETIGTGATVTYNTTKKSHQMVTTNDGDVSIVQTFQTHNYFSGKAQLVEMTTFDFEAQANIEKRFGYFSSNESTPFNSDVDGFFLCNSGNTHFLRIVNNGTEILMLPQSQWDDPLDGTGRSGVNIDWGSFNIFQFNFLWLGGSGLSLALIRGTSLIEVHNYDHVAANTDNLIFSSPNKPIRYEVRQDGDSVSGGTFNPVCATVSSEGSTNSSDIGSVRSIDTDASDVINAGAGTEFVVKAIRLQDSQKDITIDILDTDAFVETNNDFFRWRLLLNPVVTGGTLTWSNVSDSAVQEATGDGTLEIQSEGIVISSGYGASRGNLSSSINNARKMGSTINGVRDIIVLTIEPIQGSTNMNSFGSITYKEFI